MPPTRGVCRNRLACPLLNRIPPLGRARGQYLADVVAFVLGGGRPKDGGARNSSSIVVRPRSAASSFALISKGITRHRRLRRGTLGWPMIDLWCERRTPSRMIADSCTCFSFRFPCHGIAASYRETGKKEDIHDFRRASRGPRRGPTIR